MRLAPVPIFFVNDPALAIHYAGESSRTTHGAPEAVDACRYFAGLIAAALRGTSKDELLSPAFHPVDGRWQPSALAPAIDSVARGSFVHHDPPDIRGAGYVVKSLEAALWAFAKTTSFEEGALLAVNLGDDADTTGAVYGQVAGAYYGASAIPHRWRTVIQNAARIEKLADELLKGASTS